MKVLVTGAGGQLGHELCGTVAPGHELRATNHAGLDIGDADAVRALVSAFRPDLIINAAAYTAVDRAESEPEAALRVNAEGAANVARAATETGARLVHISTDYVFGGKGREPWRPDDPVNPVGAYARSKTEGERRVTEESRGRAVILRTAWLYSSHGHNFVKTMLKLMASRPRITVVNDQYGTPTWARDLARAIWRLAEFPALAGNFHWTDDGQCSWCDFALAIRDEAAALGIIDGRCEIVPIPSSDYPTPAPRPAWSVLDKESTWQALGLHARPWRDCLRDMLHEMVSGLFSDPKSNVDVGNPPGKINLTPL